MRHILRFAFLAVLLGATSANAQDCSTANQPTKTWSQQPPDPMCGTVADHPFTVVSTTVDTCTNNNTGVVYAQSVRQVTGNGMWRCWASDPSALNSKCNPTITQEVTYATDSTDYNRFYLRAWDADPSHVCSVFVAMSRQDFWQCKGVACKNCGTCYVHVCCVSPVLVDVGGHGFALTDAADGVMFDIAGTGTPIQIGWTAPGANNAFLALPGADGLVHNGQKLFGNFTSQPPSATPNGFAALAVFDQPSAGGNGDGVIDKNDLVFTSLRLWIDANHDGIATLDEMHTLPSLGVNSISLKYKEDDRTDQFGNVFRYRAQVNPGGLTNTARMAYDVFFVGIPPTAKYIIPAGGKCQAPTSKVGTLAPVGGTR